MKVFSRTLLGVAAAGLMLASCESPEQKVERLYKSGTEFLEEGDLGRANVQFQNVLKINDQHVPTLTGLATIAEEAKNFEAMFGMLERIVRLDPDNVEALGKLGKLYLISGDETAALDFAERALAVDAADIDAQTLKAAVLLRVGDTATATAMAQDVQSVMPENAEAATIITTVRAMDGDIDGALQELDRVLGLDPKRAVLQLLRIRLLGQQGKEDEVLDNFAALTELFPEEPTYFRTYALALIEREDYDAAIVQLERVAELRADELDAKLDVIRVLNDAKGSAAAEQRLRNFIEDNPEDSELQLALADFLSQQNKTEEALELLSALSRSDDEDDAATAKNRMATIYLRSGQREKADEIVTEILEEDAGNVGALLRRAQFNIGDGEIDTAIADLRTVLNNDPDSYEAMLLMASAFEQQGNRDVARAELAKAFEASNQDKRVGNVYAKFLLAENELDRAEDVLQQSLARQSDDIDNLKLLAQARLRKQDWRGAEEVANILSNFGASEEEAALSIRSIALSGMEEFDQVIDLLSAQKDQEPLATSPLAVLVQAYVAEQRFEEAKTTLGSVLDANPDNYAARLLMAQVVGAEGGQAELEQILRDAIAASPARPEAYIQLYRIYAVGGDSDRADAIIEQALANAPESNALKIYKADTLLSRGDREGALALYDDLIEVMPNNKIVVNNFISLSSLLRPDPESAQQALQHVDKIADEQNPFFQDTVGWAYYRAGNYLRAVEFLTRAADGAPQNAEILYHLGAAKLAAGEESAGMEILQRAIAEGGEDFEFASEVQSLLNQ